MNQSGEFDINKLHVHQERRNLEKIKLYDIILKRAYNRIETVAVHGHQCLFNVPEFLLGMPLYDAFQCSGYILQKLKKNAFFKNVVYGVLISECICVMPMRCAKQRMLPNLPNNVFLAKV